MLPAERSKAAGDSAAQFALEKYPSHQDHVGQGRQSVQSSDILSRCSEKSVRSIERDTDQWISSQVSSDSSDRGSDRNLSTASSHNVITDDRHSCGEREGMSEVHRTPSTRGGQHKRQSLRHVLVDSQERSSEHTKQPQRKRGTSSKGNYFVSMAKTRPTVLRVQPNTVQRRHINCVVCVLCRKRLQCQHCGRDGLMRNDCFGQQFNNSSLSHESHSLTPLRASLGVSVHTTSCSVAISFHT